MPIPVFVSVHDVMPSTWDAVLSTLSHLEGLPHSKVHLLVVPGCEWEPKHMDQLRRWKEQGYEFSGHGRIHHCGQIKTLYHRLHSLLISRDVAEHLSLSTEQISELIGNGYRWFEENQLGVPRWYVPPAWAMGNISFGKLSELPFRFYEFQSGVFDSRHHRFYRIPLLGYEADTLFRSTFLSLFNACNRSAARFLSKPIRLSIHPFDFDYRLGAALKNFVNRLGKRSSSFECVADSEFFAD